MIRHVYIILHMYIIYVYYVCIVYIYNICYVYIYIMYIYIYIYIYIHIYMSILTHIGGSDAVVHTHCIRSSKSNAVLNTHCRADHLWGWMKTVPYLMVASSRKHEILF